MDDGDGGWWEDPDGVELPEPYKTIDNVLWNVFDRSWELIETRATSISQLSHVTAGTANDVRIRGLAHVTVSKMSGNRGAGVAVVATLCGNAEVLSLRDDSSAAGTSQPSPEKKDCSSDGEGVPGSVEAPQIQTCATHVSGTVVAAAVDKAGCVQLYHGVDNVLVFRATLPASTIGDHGAVHDRNPKSTDPFLVTAAVLSDDAEWIAVSTTDHFVHVFKINTTDLIGPIGPAIASEHDGADTDDSVHSVARHAVTLQLPTVNAIRGLPSDCVDNIVTAIAPDQWATTVASTFSDEQAPLFCFCAVESGAAPWVFATWPGHNQIFRKRAELGGGPTLTGKAWTYTSAVTALASSTDSHIAVGLSSGAVSVWNVKTGFPAPLCPGGATSAVSALEFGPAGHIIVAHAGGGHAATVDYRKGVAVPLRTDLVVAADKPLNAAIPPLLTAAVERVGGSVAAASGKENVVVAGNLDALFVAVRNRVFAFAPSNATARAVYTFDEKDRVLQILPINGGVYVVVEQAGGADNQVSAQLVKLDGPPPDDAGVDVGSESKEAVLTIDMALKQDINMRASTLVNLACPPDKGATGV